MSQEVPSFAAEPQVAEACAADGFASSAMTMRTPTGLSLRYLGTLVLMLVLVPLFLASAIFTMPLALFGALAAGMRSSWRAARISH